MVESSIIFEITLLLSFLPGNLGDLGGEIIPNAKSELLIDIFENLFLLLEQAENNG